MRPISKYDYKFLFFIFGIFSQHVQVISAEADPRFSGDRNFLEDDGTGQVSLPELVRRRTGVDDSANNEQLMANDVKNGIDRLLGAESVNDPKSQSHYEMPIFPTKPGHAAGMKMDAHGRVQMGVSSAKCDDAKTNLTMDWDFSPVNYTCFHPETRFPLNPDLSHLWECDNVPQDYSPNHFCMDQYISYEDQIPTVGDHRPLWPVYGEYLFVPRQRWLHNIEHGALVMLYHPCAQPEEVKRLRGLVTGCFDKHVITPSTLVSPERPLVLVAWGCRLSMATVEDDVVVKFIQQKAMKGPEDTKKEGQYTFGLIKPANEDGTAQYGVIKCGRAETTM